MVDKKLVTVPIDDLIPYENNPRNNDGAVDKVKESIRQCEYISPIIVDEDMVILAGHTRLKAFKQMMYSEVEVMVVTGLDDEQKRKYRLLDNKTSEFAGWDFEALELELEGLDFEGVDFGFDNEGAEADPVIEDEYEEAETEKHGVSRGNVWKLGNHRLMCGDSTNESDVLKLIGGKKVDMLFTDPPYGYQYQSNQRTKSEKFEVITNDDKILDFFPCIKKIVSGFVFVCTTWKVLDKWIPLFKKYYDLSNMIIWDKGGGGIGDLKHTFSTDYEVILCACNGKEITGKRIGSMWDVGKDASAEYVHPTQKPVGLSALAINNTTNPGDIVLDLFGGSGSTLLACEQTGRTCYMMEYEPEYVDVILSRWEQFTGEKAELIEE